MVKNEKKLVDVLGLLATDYLRFARSSRSLQGLWYWRYYQENKGEIEDAQLRRKIYQQIYHLERFGYINKNGLTSKALERLRRIKSYKNEVKKWDKKWRVVIFDIPEKRKSTRNQFRESLKNLGFKLLQHSIWVCPEGDFEEIQNLVKEQRIERCVVLMMVDKISNELLFRQKFGLL